MDNQYDKLIYQELISIHTLLNQLVSQQKKYISQSQTVSSKDENSDWLQYQLNEEKRKFWNKIVVYKE